MHGLQGIVTAKRVFFVDNNAIHICQPQFDMGVVFNQVFGNLDHFSNNICTKLQVVACYFYFLGKCNKAMMKGLASSCHKLRRKIIMRWSFETSRLFVFADFPDTIVTNLLLIPPHLSVSANV